MPALSLCHFVCSRFTSARHEDTVDVNKDPEDIHKEIVVPIPHNGIPPDGQTRAPISSSMSLLRQSKSLLSPPSILGYPRTAHTTTVTYPSLLHNSTSQHLPSALTSNAIIMPKPRGGGTAKKGTSHHCPRQGKGPGQCVIVKDGGQPYCRTHCWRCEVEGHGNAVQLFFQTCAMCDRAAELPLQQEADERAQQISQTHPKLQKFGKKQ